MTGAHAEERYRWFALAAFVLSSTINYLDRQTLATLEPLLKAEFHLSNAEYGWILSAFSLTYAASAPFAGLLIDRVGLNRAISFAVGLWSLAGIATGFTQGLAGLVACRAALGGAEAAGIPAAGKAIHRYLAPAERALGNAMNQAGVSLGAILAPPVATWLALTYGWRAAFAATGALGLLWVPLWLWIARRAPETREPQPAGGGTEILRDRRLWHFVAANALSMLGYSLWTNWTTPYLVHERGLTLAQAAWYAWIPPLAATLGGFAGGAASMALIRRGGEPVAARGRVCTVAAALGLSAALAPAAPTVALAAAAISLSFFSISAFSVNVYTLPLDVFGGARAAFAVSILVSSYGATQALVSPLFGSIIDHFGYAPVMRAAALAPALAALALWRGRRRA